MVFAFAYYKSQGLKDTIFKDKSMYVYFGGAAVFVLFAILSTLFAQYKNVAMWGAPERCEGLGMIVIYILIYIFTDYKNDVIVDAVFVVVLLVGFVVVKRVKK